MTILTKPTFLLFGIIFILFKFSEAAIIGPYDRAHNYIATSQPLVRAQPDEVGPVGGPNS